MQPRDDKAKFRITTWPGQPIQLSEIPLPYPDPARGSSVSYELLPSGGLIGRAEVEPKWRQAGETYLELQRLDLEDSEAILEFVNQFGVLGARWRQGAPPIPIPRDGSGGGSSGWDQVLGPSEAHNKQRRLIAEARAAVEGERDHAFLASETVTEFRIAAKLIRDLTKAWRVVSIGYEPDAWESEIAEDAFGFDPIQERLPVDGLTHAQGAAIALERYLSPILTAFSPRIQRFRVEDPPDDPIFFAPSLFWLFGLELHNHIAESAEYKVCQNDRCGRLYYRQRGRAEHGQYRTMATKYCTPECARAVAQRRYRRKVCKGT